MKIYKIAAYEEELPSPTKSINEVKLLTPQFVQKAQEVYDEWDEQNIDVYAGGGICHLIADEIASILCENDIEVHTMSNDDQHVSCLVRVIEGIGEVDIHYSWYEIGAVFTWEKIPDVVFDDSMVTIHILDSDYNSLGQYVELF